MKHSLQICVLVVASAFSVSGFASEQKNLDDMQKRYMQHMAKELDLSAEQQEQISAINKDYAGRYRELGEKHRQDIKALLDEQQQAKMQEMHEQRRARMSKHHSRQTSEHGNSHPGGNH